MPPTARDAIERAREWIETRRGDIPGYRGAYLSGSVARLPEEADIPPGSDVDVMVVGDEGRYVGKYVTADLIIEGTTLESATALDPKAVLGDYHLAPGLVNARILDDPRGDIARAQAAVRARYADMDTITARLDHVEDRARATLTTATDHRTIAERITAWQFGVGQVAHMVLVAALENPTVRKRYIAAGEVLSRFDEEAAYERLLRLARVNRIRRPAVEALARELDTLLAIAGPVADGSDWRFASDISTPMRPVIMDGIRAMIADRWHREAMFWIVATWCRCAQLLERQVPGAAAAANRDGIVRLRRELRVPGDDDLTEAVAEALEAIPAYREVAGRIAREVAGAPPGMAV